MAKELLDVSELGIPKLNITDREINIVVQVNIPNKTGTVNYNKVISPETIMETYKEEMINALVIRMKSCVQDLLDNKDRIISSDKYQTAYERSNGVIHLFNNHSYTEMENAIHLLNNGSYGEINRFMCDQIIKALYNTERPEDKGIITFDNLIMHLTTKMMIE